MTGPEEQKLRIMLSDVASTAIDTFIAACKSPNLTDKAGVLHRLEDGTFLKIEIKRVLMPVSSV